MKHLLSWVLARITPAPAVRLPDVTLPPDVPRETSPPAQFSYRQLLEKRDAFFVLRNKIDDLLSCSTVVGGQIGVILIDEDTGDLLVSGVFMRTERTYRVRITEEEV